MEIPVVDIFAGPGGLSEGFSSFHESGSGRPGFRIVASAEKDPAAHSTLLLRAFVRQFGDTPPRAYYEFLSRPDGRPSFPETHKAEWRSATEEAHCVTLGNAADTSYFHETIKKRIGKREAWVLVGGPPCQAYSLVGRSRNKSIRGYKPESDARHFLYREYLTILHRFHPAVFIMENVKGILSAKVHGTRIFGQILTDLADPGRALASRRSCRYEILPLAISSTDHFELDVSRFIVRSENFGVPQARHRVILLGIRTDIGTSGLRPLVSSPETRLADAWFELPALRSGLTERTDSADRWRATVEQQRRLILKALPSDLASTGDVLRSLQFSSLNRGGNSIPVPTCRGGSRLNTSLKRWVVDDQLSLVLNHETRGHMDSDLGRYMFCAAFAVANNGRSPTSAEFPRALAPSHKNWSSGMFADRFRVHAPNAPSATITSHISKDSHYYIHHSPEQCRGMTVREAARLQTFPDNYFFMGTRTQQYIQVGNAVPPLLANQIAAIVWGILAGERVTETGRFGNAVL